MPIVRHADPDAFLAASLPAVARDAAVAAIFRAFAAGVKRRPPAPDERLYLATWHGEDRSAAAVQRGDYALFVDTPRPDLAARFADDLAGEHPSLQGVTGALAICEAFARRWRVLTSRTAVMRAHLRHHVLTELASVSSAPGTMRVAADADLDWLIEASIAFAAEAGLPDSPAQVRRNVPQFHAQGRYRIWEDSGRAAFAGWSDAGEGEARVGPVYTPPQTRRHGYATALVAALSRELIDAGRRRIFLTTDVANPTSNAIYARIGYRALSDFCHFDFVFAPDG
jgi:predicted GNAT family acetyltransferase